MTSEGNREAQPWTSRSIGSRFQHSFFYLLIKMRAIWVAYALSRLVVLYYVLFRPFLARRADPYLSRRFPGIRGAERLRYIYRLDLALAITLVERAMLGIMGNEAIAFHFPERERLRALAKEKKGLVLIMAHVGGWQIVMSALRFLDLPVNLLLHRDAGDIDRHYFEHRPEERGLFKIIDPGEEMGGMLRAMEVLKKGEVVCIMGDRTFGDSRNIVPVVFLGDPIPVPYSPFKLASATGSPVAIMFSHRSGRREYRIILDRVLRIPPDLGRRASSFQPYAAALVRGLEAFVERFPFQFFNFYDMWQGTASTGREVTK